MKTINFERETLLGVRVYVFIIHFLGKFCFETYFSRQFVIRNFTKTMLLTISSCPFCAIFSTSTVALNPGNIQLLFNTLTVRI